MEIDELMDLARVSGDENLFELIESAARVTIVLDDLSEEWVLSFVDYDDVTRYAYVPIHAEGAAIASWLLEQGMDSHRVRLELE